MIHGSVIAGSYFDSVALMAASQRLRRMPGIVDVALVMATPANKAILASAGLFAPQFEAAREDDLLVAIAAIDAQTASRAATAVDAALQGEAAESSPDAPRTLAAGLRRLPEASLALISVPGRFAAEEAFEALRLGLHVMVFSDNVSVEDEVALKRLGKDRGLLVMGPDCGSAIISGVPLGFANAVRRGSVGIVSASGTGLQEVSSIVSNQGAGVSHAVGVGGRDASRQVGGIMLLEAFRLLMNDQDTQVIVLISKPPDTAVIDALAKEAAQSDRPVVAAFLGNACGTAGPWTYCAATLEEAGIAAAMLAKAEDVTVIGAFLDTRKAAMNTVAEQAKQNLTPGQRFVRGLFSGGTLCGEAAAVMAPSLGTIHGNLSSSSMVASGDPWVSSGHAVIDLGADEFTVGRPHPMIDYSLRCRRIMQEASDPDIAVVLLDVVLGYGAHPDPAAELVPVIRNARGSAVEHGRHLMVVCAVTGTEDDPQRRSTVEQALRDAGALVAPSNAAAAHLAAAIVEGRES
jgi:succinyl-CoA synthetase alpha subunit